MIDLNNALVYDCEVFPNAFTLHLQALFSDFEDTFEFSEFKNDMPHLMATFNWLQRTATPTIGFNNVHYDYPIIHYIYHNPQATPRDIYNKSKSIINSFADKFAHTIWPNERFTPQIDLFKINHFDNKAKSTNLKALQINMRSQSVVECSLSFDEPVTAENIQNEIIPYNKHDVSETKKFALHNLDALRFRISMIQDFGVDVMNWSDTKIGSSMMEKKLGNELCYEPSASGYGKGQKRQTPRSRIAINDIIFPYVRFDHPEFNRILNYLRGQVLTGQQIIDALTTDEEPQTDTNLKTKGFFKNLKATINGFDFCFGQGGIHGSVSSQRVIASDDWWLRDIDVAALYPSIGIVNKIRPEHLGERFSEVYSQLPTERKQWQEKKGKKCVEANTLKLASNGVYGNSNNKFSVFYDPKYTMTITINGQLLLCMLAEKLMTVPTLKIIQINTDGITYFIRKDYEPMAAAICREWEKLTALTLEDANYKRMFIRDVNNYIAEGFDGSLKLKGAYWSPDPLNYAASISNAQPPAWHKDLGNVLSIRAAVAAMVNNVDPELFVRLCANPFDFMCRIKANRADKLYCGSKLIQRNTRYYVSTDGEEMIKIAPPTGAPGSFKKAPKVSDYDYSRLSNNGQVWHPDVCTKNQSRHEERRTGIQAGHRVTVCNDLADFRFDNINYAYYVNEAKKLIV